MARNGSADLGQGAAAKCDPCGLRLPHLVEDFSLHTFQFDILAFSPFALCPSASTLSRGLFAGAGSPSMALLVGLFFPAKMSTKCGGKRSPSVSGSSRSLLPLGTSNTLVLCAASVSVPLVVPCGGVTWGDDDGLANVFFGAPSCRIGLPGCHSGFVSAVCCLCPTVGRLLLSMPTAGPHQRSSSLLSSLPTCLAGFSPHLRLYAGCSVPQT